MLLPLRFRLPLRLRRLLQLPLGRLQSATFRSLPGPARSLLTLELLSTCATSLGHTAALSWLAERGGPGALVVFSAWLALTTLVGLPVLSPLGDRFSKPGLIRWGSLALGLIALLQALLACADVLGWQMLVITGALAAMAQAVTQPAQVALLPDLVPPEHLSQAIRLRRGWQAIGSLSGPLLAGLALACGPLQASLCLHAILAGLCAAAGLALRGPAIRAVDVGRPPWLDLLRAGWRAKWQVRVDRWWTLSGALMMLFYGPAVGLLLPLRLQALHASTAWLGLCQAALAMGVLIGVLGVAEALIQRVGRHRAMMTAVALCGLCIGALSACRHPAMVAGLLALMGACTSLTQLTGQTLRSLAIPEDFRSRMAAAQLTVASLAATGAPMLAGGMLLQWRVETVYALHGAAFLGAGLLLLAVPGLRTLLGLSAADAVGWYERQYPQAFRRPAAVPAASRNRHPAPESSAVSHTRTKAGP